MLWVVVKGGYLSLKKAIYKQTEYKGDVNLWQTGAMMRALTVVKSTNNEITIGFTRSEEAQKALWNKEMGREFMGLTDEELKDPEFVGLLWLALRLRFRMLIGFDSRPTSTISENRFFP